MKLLGIKAAKGNFFDRDKVKAAVDRAVRAQLSKAGAFVRRRAKSSIRYRKKASAPGMPPSGHKSITRTKTNRKGVTKSQLVSPLREFIFFSYDPSSRSVVIGPALLSSGRVGKQVLPALEYGGTSTASGRKGKTRTITVRARPFMRPALEQERKNVPELFRGSVR